MSALDAGGGELVQILVGPAVAAARGTDNECLSQLPGLSKKAGSEAVLANECVNMRQCVSGYCCPRARSWRDSMVSSCVFFSRQR